MDNIGGTIVTVDIGTSSVTIIISKINKFNKLEIIHVDTKPIEQLVKGEIIEPYKIADILKTMFNAIEEKHGFRVKSAYINIPNKYVIIEETTGEVEIDAKIKTVQQCDMDKLFNTIKNMQVQSDLKIIDVFPIEYYNDGEQVLQSPLFANTTKLKLKAQIVLAQKPYVEKLEAIMQYSKVKIDGIILQSYSNSMIALTQEQLEKGTLLIDVGGSTTDLSIYYKNRLIYIDYLDLGGYNVTSDLAVVLDMNIEEAEKLKRQYPLSMKQYIENNIDVSVLNNMREKQTIKTSRIVEIIQARCEEILEIVNSKLEQTQAKQYVNEVVIIGQGFNQLSKIEIIAKQKLDREIKLVNFKHTHLIKPMHITPYSMQEYVLYNKSNINNMLSVVEESQTVKKPTVFSKLFERVKDFLYT